MRFKNIFLMTAALAAALPFCPVPASASELSGQLEKIDKQFVKDASVKYRGTARATLAVLPFQAEEKLAAKRVDMAVTELLTQKLMREASFNIVERENLDAALKERRLNPVEAGDAAKAGKLAGAKLAVLGGISRLGGKYQINAKLVDTESGELVSVAVVEVPAKVFDQEAFRYLVLAPEVQTMSFYFTGKYAQGTAASELAPRTYSGVTFTPTNKKPEMTQEGIGIKYFPAKRRMVDVAFLATRLSGNGPLIRTDETIPSDADPRALMKGFELKVSYNYQIRLTDPFNLYAGYGVTGYALQPDEYSSRMGSAVQLAAVDGWGKAKMLYITPIARLGLEWKPQQRFGLSVFGTANLVKKRFKMPYEFRDNTSAPVRITLWDINIPQYFGEVNLSWYF